MKAPSQIEIMQKIETIWHAVLGMPIDGYDENFFVLGGNSIQAMEITNRINESFNLKLEMSIADFFDALTIENIAKWITVVHTD